MKHPTLAELTDLERGELPIERAREIRDHLETCETCRQTWEEVQEAAGNLLAWEDEPVSTTFVTSTISAIEEAERVLAPAGRGFGPAWIRRIPIAAAAVLVSLLFQAFVWNPLESPRSFRAIFDLTPEVAALSDGTAIPDTILVLTVGSDGTVTTEILGEQSGELDELIPLIIERSGERDFRAVLLLGSDPEGSVTIDRHDLEPLLSGLGIEKVTAGAGVVLIAGRGDIVARIGVPIEYVVVRAHEVGVDSVRSIVADRLEARAATLTSDRVALVLTRADSLHTSGEFAIEMRYDRGEERPQVQVIRPRLEVRSRIESTQSLLDSLQTPSRLIITMNDEGRIITSWAVLDLEEFRDMAGRLTADPGDLSILVLIPEGEEEREALLLEILEEIGGDKITIRRIKKDGSR